MKNMGRWGHIEIKTGATIETWSLIGVRKGIIYTPDNISAKTAVDDASALANKHMGKDAVYLKWNRKDRIIHAGLSDEEKWKLAQKIGAEKNRPAKPKVPASEFSDRLGSKSNRGRG